MYGDWNPIVAGWNLCCRKTAPSVMKGHLLYAIPSEAPQSDSGRNKSFLYGDFDLSKLIHGGIV